MRRLSKLSCVDQNDRLTVSERPYRGAMGTQPSSIQVRKRGDPPVPVSAVAIVPTSAIVPTEAVAATAPVI
jgi:hypothetical protein